MGRRVAVSALFLLAASFAWGCSKKEHALPVAPEAQLPALAPGTMVARVNGTPWQGTFVDSFLQGSPGFESLVVSGYGTFGSNQLLILLVLPPRVAAGPVYALDDDVLGRAGCFVARPGAPGLSYTTDDAHTGTVTFTLVDAPHVVGTFHFDAVGDSGAVRVAEGSFDATIDQGAAASARTKSRLRAAAITEALRSRR